MASVLDAVLEFLPLEQEPGGHGGGQQDGRAHPGGQPQAVDEGFLGGADHLLGGLRVQ